MKMRFEEWVNNPTGITIELENKISGAVFKLFIHEFNKMSKKGRLKYYHVKVNK